MFRDGEPDDSGLWGPDEEEIDALEYDDFDLGDPIQYEEHVTECPACGKMISEDMDCCPYCGDILFRTWKDGTFIPRSRPWRNIIIAVIATIIALGVAAFVYVNVLR